MIGMRVAVNQGCQWLPVENVVNVAEELSHKHKLGHVDDQRFKLPHIKCHRK